MIASRPLREQTLDAVSNPDTCVAHRRNLDAAAQGAVVERLIREGLLAASDPAAAIGGVFPVLRDDPGDCPKPLQAFSVAPGGHGSHHDYPGGLAIHEAYNLTSALNLAKQNEEMYLASGASGHIDLDVVRAAVIWHDWAKTLVHVWNVDGTITNEMDIAGTGSHHILGLAESMARHLPAREIVAQACAHASPAHGANDHIVQWIRAAAIVARQDPVREGYLARGPDRSYQLPAIRPLEASEIMTHNPDAFTSYPEAVVTNLADANFYSVAATAQIEIILSALGPEFGFPLADTARYRNGFRNPILSYASADRLAVLFRDGGLDAVRRELSRLRTLGIFGHAVATH